MMTAKNKCSFLMILGIFLTVGIASLNASSESFAEEAGQTNIGVMFYGGKTPLETEDITKSTEQPTAAQMSLPRTGERNSRWLYSLGVVCLLIVIISFYYLNKKRKKEK